MPDLFGRATIVMGRQHGHREHHGLRETVQELRALCSRVRSGAAVPAPELTDPADAFFDRVLVHFSAEEGADYFGTLSSETAELAEGIARLLREHAELTALINRLRALSELEDDAVLFVTELERFLDGFSEHERGESALLQRFFTAD